MTRAMLWAAALAAGGCSTFAALTTPKAPPQAAVKPIIELEPGMIELEAGSVGESREGKADHWGLGAGFTLWKQSSYFAGAHAQLLDGANVVAEADLPVNGDGQNETWISVGDQGMDEGHFLASSKSLTLPVQGGAYTLRVTVGTSGPGAPPSVTFEEKVTVVATDTTGGTGVMIEPFDYLEHGALRFQRDVYGHDFGYHPDGEPTFWMTLPTDYGQKKSRADFLVYHDGKMAGRFSQEMDLGKVHLNEPFVRPVRFFGWPEAVKWPAVRAAGGTWSVHVFHDGQYVTTCPWVMDGKKVAGVGHDSRRLDCAPAPADQLGDARAQMKGVKGYAADPFRKKTLVALHRSDEARKLLIEIRRAERFEQRQQMRGADADDDLENAITYKQAKNATDRLLSSAQAGKEVQGELAGMRARFAKLVEKVGR